MILFWGGKGDGLLKGYVDIFGMDLKAFLVSKIYILCFTLFNPLKIFETLFKLNYFQNFSYSDNKHAQI